MFNDRAWRVVSSREAFAAPPLPVLTAQAGPGAVLPHTISDTFLVHTYNF